MFRSKSIILVFFLTVSLLSACGDKAQDQNSETVNVAKRTGIIRELTEPTDTGGTHLLQSEQQEIVFLKSANTELDLAEYLNKVVEVTGLLETTAEAERIMLVTALQPKITELIPEKIEYLTYFNLQFGFQVRYPNLFDYVETAKGVIFEQAGEKIIEVTVLANQQAENLADFLQFRYNYTLTQLTEVKVANQAGYLFESKNGLVVYFAAGHQIFALALHYGDNAEPAELKDYFLEFVKNFQLSEELDLQNLQQQVLKSQESESTEALTETETAKTDFAQEGEFCNEAQKFICGSGLQCVVEDPEFSQTGICQKIVTNCQQVSSNSPQAVTADQMAVNVDLPNLTQEELMRGWYYGDCDEKRAGTPDTWFLVNSGTRAAMWRRTENTAPETQPDLPTPNQNFQDLAEIQQQIFDLVAKNIAELVPELDPNYAWEVRQVAFVEETNFPEENFVYIFYQTPDNSRKLLLSYPEELAAVPSLTAFTQKAYFKPGTETDWILVEGVDVTANQPLTVIASDGSAAQILEGYRLLENSYQNYALQYPRDWYWQNISREQTEFAESPFPEATPRIVAEVVVGADFVFGEPLPWNEQNVIYVALTAEKSLELKANPEDLAILEIMAQTVQKID